MFISLHIMQDEKTFTEEEEEKLQAAFVLDSKDLEIVLDASSFILEQAAYHSAKPAALTQQLQSLEVEEEKVTALDFLISALRLYSIV